MTWLSIKYASESVAKKAWQILTAVLHWLEEHHKAVVYYSVGAAAIAFFTGSLRLVNHADAAFSPKEVKTGIHSVFAESRDITIAVIGKCQPGKPDTCGLVPSVRAMVQQGSATLALSQQQIQQVEPLIKASATSITGIATDVQSSLKPLPAAIQSFSGAATALTGTAHSASGMLQTAQTTIAALQPVPGHVDDAVDSFNALLRSPDLSGTLHNANLFVYHGQAILGDAQKVADKETQDFLKPVPWWKWPLKRIGETWDIGAAVARHAP
ncbi:hypothetical protein KGP36_06060 [Patescibacteria group bacterium]|nr:hypothetical protein [Patescibacteria group bacterium]